MRGTGLRARLIGASVVIAGIAIALIVAASGGTRTEIVRQVRHQTPPHLLAPSRPALPRRTPASRHRTAAQPQTHRTTASRSLPRMIGQQLMVGMTGTTPDPGLLARIRAGEVGGVILYSNNIQSPAQTAALVRTLQAAAREGGNPPLLISTDQEGGQVKRLAWAPPTIAPPQMGRAGLSVSGTQGELTGRALRAVGINVDLAPVVDVAHSPQDFIWQQGRSFGMTAQTVIDSAGPFAYGLENAGVAPTAKHFPGLGGALSDTDYGLQHVTSQRRDLAPYRVLISDHIPLIMVSIAVYSNLDRSEPAALSRPIITGLLRNRLGFQGAVITDDLTRPTGYTTSEAVVRAANSGADIILVSTTESAGADAYNALLAAAQDGAIALATIRAADQQVLTLKRTYAGYTGAGL